MIKVVKYPECNPNGLDEFLSELMGEVISITPNIRKDRYTEYIIVYNETGYTKEEMISFAKYAVRCCKAYGDNVDDRMLSMFEYENKAK